MQAKPLVIFDFDGVIADSLEVFHQAFLDCLPDGPGVFADKEDYLHLFDGNLWSMMLKAGYTEMQVKESFTKLDSRIGELLVGVQYFVDIPYALSELAKSARLAMVTNNLGKEVKRFCVRHHLPPFEITLGCEDGECKVAKIGKVMEELGVEKASYVGDTVSDMHSANGAGIRGVGVAWGWHTPERLLENGASFILDTPLDFSRLLG